MFHLVLENRWEKKNGSQIQWDGGFLSVPTEERECGEEQSG